MFDLKKGVTSKSHWYKFNAIQFQVDSNMYKNSSLVYIQCIEYNV